MKEVELEVGEKASRVDKATCPHCDLKMHKVIETKSLFDGSLTFRIIKLKCEKCNREYLDLEQAEVHDMYLILNKRFAGKPLESMVERFSKAVK